MGSTKNSHIIHLLTFQSHWELLCILREIATIGPVVYDHIANEYTLKLKN